MLSLNQHTHFSKIIDALLDHRLLLIDQTTEQMNKIINYTKMITENAKTWNSMNDIKQQKQDLNVDLNKIENDFSKKNSIVNSFLDYINRQNDDFRPKANGLSIELDNLIQTKTNEWKNLFLQTNSN